MSDSGLIDFIATVLSECEMDEASDAEVAELICSRLNDAEYRELTNPLLCKVIARVRRVNEPRPVRARRMLGAEPTPADPVADRAAWLNEQLFIPGRESTTWGEATVADHMARIDYLRMLCAKNEKLINKHQQAIDVLRRTGAKRLADVKVRGAVAA